MRSRPSTPTSTSWTTVEDRAPGLTVRVCDGLPCAMQGAEALLAQLRADAGEDVRVVRAPCMGRCDCAPTVEVGHRHIDRAEAAAVEAAVAARETAPIPADTCELAAYRATGGYTNLTACRTGKMTPDEVMAHLDQAGLRGMGGAGFPASRKWAFVRAEPGPRAICINADEGEPGTFKDRLYLERDPHRILEGALIAAWGVDAEEIYVYLRDEYPAAHGILSREIAALEGAGLNGGVRIELRPRRGCLYLWRRKRHDRIHRRQARIAAPSPPLRRPDRCLRPADAGP